MSSELVENAEIATQTAVLVERNTMRAIDFVKKARTHSMDVNMDAYPFFRDAAIRLTNAELELEAVLKVIRDNPLNQAAAARKFTVIITDDTREWDENFIGFIESCGPEFIRDDIMTHYYQAQGGDVDQSPETWFEERGGTILAVIPGHVQIEWAGGKGVDNGGFAWAFEKAGE